MNLLHFMLTLIIPYQGTTGSLSIANGLPTYTFGSYNQDIKELTIEYTCIYHIGTTYMDFGQLVQTTQVRDNGFNEIYLSISDIYIVAPTTSITIYQAKHTYYFNYLDSNRNYSIESQYTKEIENPISSTFTITSDTEVTFPLLSFSNTSYQQGYKEGYDTGYLIGHDSGYQAGEVAGNGVNNVISWFGNVWNALASFLGLEIAPNVKIFEIITIPIVIGVLMFVLKALIK